jgi:hypothetical protein
MIVALLSTSHPLRLSKGPAILAAAMRLAITGMGTLQPAITTKTTMTIAVSPKPKLEPPMMTPAEIPSAGFGIDGRQQEAKPQSPACGH